MKTFISALVLLVIVGVVFVSPLIAYTTKADVEFTVSEKERVCTGGNSGSCKYLIFTDQGVFENTDTIWYFKFNSSDVYGSLHEGGTYKAEVYGFRFPFLSWYKNIIAVQAL